MNDKGYVDLYRPGHPLARGSGWVGEHRLVAWEHGILTNPTDDVHHIDSDKTNNEPANLEALSHGGHAREHALARHSAG